MGDIKFEDTRAGTIRNGIDRLAYAEFIKGYWWDNYFTSIFDREKSYIHTGRKEPYYAIKHVVAELKKCNAVRGFVVAEPFQSGDLHIHGIFAGAGPFWKPELLLPWEIWDKLFKRFGRAKVERSTIRKRCLCIAQIYLKQQSRVCDYYELFGNGLSWLDGKIGIN